MRRPEPIIRAHLTHHGTGESLGRFKVYEIPRVGEYILAPVLDNPSARFVIVRLTWIFDRDEGCDGVILNVKEAPHG